MAKDDAFEPRLGKIRAGSQAPFARTIRRLVARAGGVRSGRSSRFTGSRIGRGAGIGRLLTSRDQYSALRSRHVIIKGRLIRLAKSGLSGAIAHLRYLQRDGVTREGASGDLYDARHDKADGRQFLERGAGDRHQFRFIVSAEDAIEYPDLKSITRRLMQQMDADLGTRLEWVAVDHYNTGHPHSHIVLRGKDERGKDLIIAREYLSYGIRERAAEIVTLDLGPRTDDEIRSRLRGEMEQERFTGLDRNLIREARDGIVRSGQDQDAFRQTLRAGRLQKLKRLGLAEEIAPSKWRLAPDLEPILRRMGERGDIIKTMHREMARAGVMRSPPDLLVHEAGSQDQKAVVGRVLGRGLSDELSDRHYLIVDGVDGRLHYTDIGRGDTTTPLPEGSVVSITPKLAMVRQADRTVASVALAYDGRYSLDLHLKHDPAATAEYAQAHIRRLEAMRRAHTGVERQPDGTWNIAPDHLEKALAYERQQHRIAPVEIEMLSTLPIERQIHADGASWLDRELVATAPSALRDNGFGRDVRSAQAQRVQWLIEQGLAEQHPTGVIYRANLLAILQRRDVQRIGTQLSQEMGLRHREVTDGQRVEGTYRKHVDLASGRFAVIENAREFSLVPWRAILERSLGKPVSGIARGETVSWTFGRQRGGPSVS